MRLIKTITMILSTLGASLFGRYQYHSPEFDALKEEALRLRKASNDKHSLQDDWRAVCGDLGRAYKQMANGKAN